LTSETEPSIVISGLGSVSAWGVGTDRLWQGLLAARPAIGPLTRFSPEGYPSAIAGQCHIDIEELRHRCGADADASRADLFALCSAQEALAQAGLDSGSAGRLGVYFGGSTGGLAESEDHYERVRDAAATRVSLRSLTAQPVSNPAEEVARLCGATGPVITVSSACASGTLALGLALEALRAGEVDVALAGGSDSLARTTFGGFNALQAVDSRSCRPFRADRAGLSLGEGGAVLVLERREDLISRGGLALARLLGTGTASDAHHMTAPHPEGDGALVAMQECLRDAGVDASQVDFINAHGTGTPLNDRAEFNALRQMFPQRIDSLPVMATKSGTGHLLGSAGALEAVVTVLCLQHQRLHPAPQDGPIDPEAAVDLVLDPGGRELRLDMGMSLSLGFGGSNAVALLARSETA
jgi:3-oxoacyl-(acyl-carrier-protein) synthase